MSACRKAEEDGSQEVGLAAGAVLFCVHIPLVSCLLGVGPWDNEV